jgi:hypothetical protein
MEKQITAGTQWVRAVCELDVLFHAAQEEDFF